MKTDSIAVGAINIQSDSIVRQANKVHFLTEEILYQTIPELHQTMLKNFSYVQHPSTKFTKLHWTTSNHTWLHQTTPNYTNFLQTTTNYTKQHKTTQNNTKQHKTTQNNTKYKLWKTAIGLPSELQCTRLELIQCKANLLISLTTKTEAKSTRKYT